MRTSQPCWPRASGPPHDGEDLGAAAAVIICVPTPLGVGRRLPTWPCRRGGGRHRRRAPPAGDAGGAGVDDLPGHHRGGASGRCSRRAGLRRRQRLPPRLLPRAHRPGQPALRAAEHAEGGRRAARRRAPTAAVAFYARFIDTVVPASGHPRGRDGQAAREHLPPRQHRPGQRDGPVLPRAGHRPLGRDRRRSDQAVRLPGLLPRPGRGRPLHPDRPELPLATTCGPSSATRSASSSWPRRSTRRCRRTSCSGSRTLLNDDAQAAARLPGAAARRDLQARHRRPARVARRRRWPACCANRAPR